MSVHVSSVAWRIKLPPSQKLVLLKLADNANQEAALAWPSLTTIANECGLSERAVRYTLRRLEAAGLIAVDTPATHTFPTIYRVLPDSYPQVIHRGENIAPLITTRGETGAPGGECGAPREGKPLPPWGETGAPKPSIEPSIEPSFQPQQQQREIETTKPGQEKRLNRIRFLWGQEYQDAAQPLTRRQLLTADALDQQAVEAGKPGLLKETLIDAAKGGKPFAWFVKVMEGRISGDDYRTQPTRPQNGYRPPQKKRLIENGPEWDAIADAANARASAIARREIELHGTDPEINMDILNRLVPPEAEHERPSI